MDECPECGKEFKRVGSHWRFNDHRPALTEHQKEVAVGLLMGDGNLVTKDATPYLRATMTNKEYLEYLDDVFGVMSNGVNVKLTASEAAEHARNVGLDENAKAENYSTQYNWSTRAHPDFTSYKSWYGSGEKVWPEDIDLTPTVLKHWYCGDGCWNNNGSHNCIYFAISNERKNTDKVTKLFTNAGLPEPDSYTTNVKRTDLNVNCNLRFGSGKREEVWNHMGKPLPGFEYKWPKEYHET